jgi:uncharacterized membrane protein YeaQ/YmgE (transglycosylase-associated protein family)
VVSILGWIIVIAGCLAAGVVAQLLMKARDLPYRWVVNAIAAFAGATVAGEWLLPAVDPQFEGIAVLPAIVGGLVVGAIADLGMIWFSRTRMHGGQGHGAPVH